MEKMQNVGTKSVFMSLIYVQKQRPHAGVYEVLLCGALIFLLVILTSFY